MAFSDYLRQVLTATSISNQLDLNNLPQNGIGILLKGAKTNYALTKVVAAEEVQCKTYLIVIALLLGRKAQSAIKSQLTLRFLGLLFKRDLGTENGLNY